MKTIGRTLIILAVFALVMGITYAAVNAVSSSTGGPALAQRGEGFPRPEGARPEGPRGEGRELRGRGVLGMVFGFVKNTAIVAIIVAGIVWFKNYLDDKRRAAPQATE